MTVRKATADDKPFVPDVDGPTSLITPEKPLQPAKPLQKVEQ
jgi:hypothetical protein